MLRRPIDDGELYRLVNQLLAASTVEHMMREPARLPGRPWPRRQGRTPVTRA